LLDRKTKAGHREHAKKITSRYLVRLVDVAVVWDGKAVILV
jgi:hypothetical protein